MPYTTEVTLDELHKLLKDGGLNINREQLPKVVDIEEGLERMFDSAIFSAIQEDNENRTVELGYNPFKECSYEEAIRDLLGVADDNFRSFKVSSDIIDDAGTEQLTVNTQDKKYELRINRKKDFLVDEEYIINFVARITLELSQNIIVKVLDEDGTLIMSLPADAAKFISNKFDMIELCP